MQFHREVSPTLYTIQSYGVGQVTVAFPARGPTAAPLSARILTRSCVIAPDRLIIDWPPQAFGEIEHVHFEIVAAMAPEVVLFGSGVTAQFPRADLLSTMTSKGIGVEVMNTGAACRTYNILTADGRRVAAALLMIAPP
jgi:uncharacterized protein